MKSLKRLSSSHNPYPLGAGLIRWLSEPHRWDKPYTKQNHYNGLQTPPKNIKFNVVKIIDSLESKTNPPRHPFVLRNLDEGEFLVCYPTKTWWEFQTHNKIQQLDFSIF